METQKQNTILTKRPFKPGFDMLPAKMQKTVKNELMQRCGWTTTATFINKKFGYVPIRPPEVDILHEVFKVYNLDPWTGKYLS